MKKPRSIPIMGHKVQIKWIKKTDSNELGAFYGDIDLICLLEQPRWQKTLLHEVVHAVLHYSGHATKLKQAEEEALVTALEHGLWPLISGWRG